MTISSLLHLSAGRRIFGAVLAIGLTAASQLGTSHATHLGLTGRLAFDHAVSAQAATAYAPAQIAAAYDVSPLYAAGIEGQGQTVALLEADALRLSDVNQFDKRFNLPSPKIKQYYVGGQKFPLDGTGETVLDVEWVHALAPQATIQVYYLPNSESSQAGWQSFASALRSAASHGARSIGISIGACGTGRGYTATKSALAAVMAQDVSVFVASGDTGDHPGTIADCGDQIGVGYPASDPSVVAVGGTSLDLTTDNTIAQEVAWQLSGGGVTTFARPSWQTAPQLPSDSERWTPDVSFVANPDTGVTVYFKNRWRQVGGTSVGAPAWAAIWALALQDATQHGVTLGAAPSVLYRLGDSATASTVFHDVTTGSNGEYSAGPGWDPVTGWGTPDVANLAGAVTSTTSTR